ncbi:SDR family NAD(P)-dependent oxidoreductase [Capillimicrobium parvum]|uniref:Oxidoreductase n=1 Tax=Capillimicrobium parvum TaxID=2884022 RepID=A0A9E6XY14_9ACTN|nr:glucose 1-dehydrogenase [Capillimicrobium parvum]UGS36572.1 putative oxidoreductase [Capillimicrobium parvum]
MTPAELAGRCAVVTGAGGGLGRAFSLGFARAGARVVAADVDLAAAQATVGEIALAGGSALAVAADVAREASTAAMAAAALDAFGAIDVLVNNAAIYAGLERRPFDEIDVAEWDRVMAVNLRGPWLCSKACAAALRASGFGGSIVNVASATVLSGSPLWAHYVASKGALIALSRVMARELGEAGVRVNALAPGFTLTDASRELVDDADSYGVARGAIKRSLQPQDVVGTAVFLASDASAMITGQTFVVDGGRQFL